MSFQRDGSETPMGEWLGWWWDHTWGPLLRWFNSRS